MPEVFAEKLFTTGLDEAGRGALAGPVVAAAVCLPQGLVLPGLNDSKKLSPKKREQLFSLITAQALSWSYVALSAQEVDEINVLQASLKAMSQALKKLPLAHQRPAFADGHISPEEGVEAIVQGDALVPAISAASIIAKVIRDRMMSQYHHLYPQYDLLAHKGYPTASHKAALKQHRPSFIHRKSYAPVAEYL